MIRKLLNNKNLIQIIKFGIVGCSNTLVSMITYYVCLYLGVYYVIANILGFITGTLNSFYWNNKYVFKAEKNRNNLKTLAKVFISNSGTGLILNNLLLVFWVEICRISETIAPLINAVVLMALNFLISKFWAYKEDAKK